MRGSRNIFMAVISLGMMLFAANQSCYAQSQYRRGSSNQQQPQKQQPAKQQQVKKEQQLQRDFQNAKQQDRKPPQYGNKPPQQVNRPTLPFGAKVIRGGAYDYYYVDGRYYRYINNVYVICRPPVGALIARSLLNGVITLTNYVVRDSYGRSQRCYTDNDGVYYVKSGRDYLVVEPPVGAIVYELPYGFEEVVIKGAKYYKAGENFYELVYDGPQDYYFRVVGSMR